MSRLSIGASMISVLVGAVLLVAGSQTLMPQLTLLGNPAAQPSVGETVPSHVGITPQRITAATATSMSSSPTATAVEHPDVICWSCTAVPTIAATSHPVELSMTPALPTATMQHASPTPTQTPEPTQIIERTPEISVPTATVVQPTATDVIPIVPTTALSPTAVFPIATATTVMLPTRVIIPPVPSANFQLWISSDFDPTASIYRSTGTTISWPAGEVLNFAPAITLAPPPSTDPTLFYRSQVVAWSFVGSGGQSATSIDVMGHSGCRLRDEPSPTDAAGLEGCAYRYLEHPTTDDMRMQAHAFWSAGTPLDMCIDVHTYDLGQLRDADLTLQVAIRTEAIDVATGQVLASTTAIKMATFTIRLAVPRSTR